MKKILIIITIFALLSLTACAVNKTMNTSIQNDQAAIEGSQNASTGAITEHSKTIELTMPGVIFAMATGEENLSPGIDLTNFIKRNNFTSAKWNDNLSLTVTMTKDRYEEYKADLAVPVEETLEGILTYPYMEGIEKEEGYKVVSIIVDSAILDEDAIASADDLITFYTIPMLGSYIKVYRQLIGLDNEFSIIIEDSETGTKLTGIDYPLD